MGNEASDADSIVSAILLSYFKHCTSHTTELEYIPIISSPRQDMPLKRDIEVLLNSVKIPLRDVLCIDELVKTHPQGTFGVTLTDHNEVAKAIESTYRVHFQVEGILDHHQDAGRHTHLSPEVREVAYDEEQQKPLVGSACTLVAERFLRHGVDFLDTDVCTLLLGVIAIDTKNLDPEVDRATPRDVFVVEALQQRVPELDRKALFDRISSAKSDVSFWHSLSATNAMRVDYKDFDSEDGKHRLGIASVHSHMEDFLEKADLIRSIRDQLTEKGLSICVVMGVTLEPFQREILVGVDVSLAHSVEAFLNSSHVMDELKLDFMKKVKEDDVVLFVYKQHNAHLSRKQVAPILQKIQLG